MKQGKATQILEKEGFQSVFGVRTNSSIFPVAELWTTFDHEENVLVLTGADGNVHFYLVTWDLKRNAQK